MNIAAIAIISSLVGVDAWNNECPKYLSTRGGKYRLVADGTDSGFKTCHGDMANCVYTRDMNFYCMYGKNMDYTPFQIEASYENLKENVTQTSFGPKGRAGGPRWKAVDLTGTNNDISIELYQMDVEVRYLLSLHCIL